MQDPWYHGRMKKTQYSSSLNKQGQRELTMIHYMLWTLKTVRRVNKQKRKKKELVSDDTLKWSVKGFLKMPLAEHI